MNKLKNSKKTSSDDFEILRTIKNQPDLTQRDIAKNLKLSLGKVNYCIQSLKEKGLIKINNFKKNPNKIGYLYILTPKGLSEKTKLTIQFMKRKLSEYEELKKELNDGPDKDINA